MFFKHPIDFSLLNTYFCKVFQRSYFKYHNMSLTVVNNQIEIY